MTDTTLPPSSSTPTLVAALRILARDIQSEDEVANAAIAEAAERLEEYYEAVGGKGVARVLTCVYCGHEYPQGTPAAGAQILTDHIKVCAKHPMRALEEENQRLREALSSIHTYAHCMAKAGPLYTPTLEAAWIKFMNIGGMATQALTNPTARE